MSTDKLDKKKSKGKMPNEKSISMEINVVEDGEMPK